MVVITVYGISDDMARNLKPYLELIINTASCAVKNAQLQSANISCFFPKDILSDWLGKEIIIFVDGLDDNSKGQEGVKNRLARALVDSTNHFFKKTHYPDLRKVECFIRSFDPWEGHASLNR